MTLICTYYDGYIGITIKLNNAGTFRGENANPNTMEDFEGHSAPEQYVSAPDCENLIQK